MSRFPVFSRRQYRNMLLLELVLLALLFALFTRQSHTPHAPSGQKTARRDTTYVLERESVETFTFDPNTADSATLSRLGLASWQIRALHKYRALHGRYHTPEDFQHLPGMTRELWDRLGPMVRIDDRFRLIKPQKQSYTHTEKEQIPAEKDTLQKTVKDTLPRPMRHPGKFDQPTLVDINTADTTLLQRIPGIASYRARKIVEYRQKLGGYVHLEQVMESCELPGEVLDWLTLTPAPLRQLDINHLSIRQLMRHPYISFKLAKAIVEHRQKHGPYPGIEDLKQVPGISQEALLRLQPYLLFQ